MTLLATISSMSTMVNSIGPAFQGIGEIAKRMWKGLKTWVNDNFIQPIKDKLQGMKDWWAGFKESVIAKWVAIKESINKNFITPFMGLLNAINDKIWELSDSLLAGMKKAWNYINDKLKGLWDSLPSIPELFTIKFWKKLAKDAGGALGDIGQGLLDGVKWAINGVIGLINSLFGMIKFSKTIENPFTGTEYSIGMDLSSWNIPMLAKGGIVNSPTLAMIGEAGPEAVVPLSGNNAGMGGTYNITVNAGGITDRTDKRALAREIGNMIQQEVSRNTGGSTMRGRY